MIAPFSLAAVKKGREQFSMGHSQWQIDSWDQERDFIKRKSCGLGSDHFLGILTGKISTDGV